MGKLSGRVAELSVRVTSPNGQLSAELKGYSEITPSFAAGTYRYYDESSLEDDIAKVASLLFAARTKAYFDIMSESFGSPMNGELPALSSRDRDFDTARAELVAEGRSPDGNIVISARGLRSWSVHIARGSVRRLTESEFVEQLAGAARSLVQHQMDLIRELKDDIYQRQDL